MEGATATFAMFVPEPVAPADLGIAQAYYEVCAQRMMEELPAAGGRQVGDVFNSRLLC